MAPAELIVEGHIAGLGGETGFGWVEAVAVVGGRVVAAGRAADVDATAGPATRWLRLGPGEVALPGITDAHLHLEDGAVAATALDLTGTSLPAGLAMLTAEHERLLASGDLHGWITGAGWSIDAWGRWPSPAELGAAAPERAMGLWSHDHHSRLVSPAALHLAGLGPGTADPPGGLLGHDAGGALTGVLYETAATLIDEAIPRPAAAVIEDAVVRYAVELLALGITGVHDPGEISADPELRDGPMLYARMARDGRLALRVHGSIRSAQLPRAIELELRSGDGVAPVDAADPDACLAADRYRMGWLKLFADGAMGSRTAALLEPYLDDPGRPPPPAGAAGMLITDAEELLSLAEGARAAGITSQIHAIGDLAVRVALDVLRRAGVDASGLMPRVEHVQLLAAGDAAGFRSAGIAASVQPVHLHSDAPVARRLWGERTAMAFALRTLLDAGAVVALGTDAPVESPDPWPGIAMAVTRRDPAWPASVGGTFHAEQALTLAEACRAATVGPGTTAGDTTLGRLAAGSPADLIVVDGSILAEPVPPDGRLAAARPLATMVDGVIVHRAPGWTVEPSRTRPAGAAATAPGA